MGYAHRRPGTILLSFRARQKAGGHKCMLNGWMNECRPLGRRLCAELETASPSDHIPNTGTTQLVKQAELLLFYWLRKMKLK